MDCDSMAGTWVNGQEVHGEVPLKEKDTISICDCTMILTENKIIYNIPVIRKIRANMSECLRIVWKKITCRIDQLF